jgi:hypothetical protein
MTLPLVARLAGRFDHFPCTGKSILGLRCTTYSIFLIQLGDIRMDARGRVFYPELESLRGVAALSVVMLHIIIFMMFKVPGGFDGATYYLAEVG